MNVIRGVRVVTASTVLGTLVWAGAKDLRDENIRQAAREENRVLTKEEIEKVKSPSLPFYLAIGSVPIYVGARLLDEKKKKKID